MFSKGGNLPIDKNFNCTSSFYYKQMTRPLSDNDPNQISEKIIKEVEKIKLEWKHQVIMSDR